MKTGMTIRIGGLACVLGGVIGLGAGCEAEKGPAQKAGESVDNAVQKAKDAVSHMAGDSEKEGADALEEAPHQVSEGDGSPTNTASSVPGPGAADDFEWTPVADQR